MANPDYFNATIKKLSNGGVLHIINIEEITPDLKQLIDENLPKIHSASEYDLEQTKKILRIALDADKKPEEISTVKMGAIAEFFIHLYFVHFGFKQECLFQNLEELYSIKKGHDGYYSYQGETWIMESKSTKTAVEHKSNIKKAYDDLIAKVTGKNINGEGKVISPWDNALSHAIRAKSDEGILDSIRQLSKDFIDEIYHDIGEFNVIPASTVFLNGKWQLLDSDEIFKQVEACMGDKNFKKLNVVCVTKKTLGLFLDYLKT